MPAFALDAFERQAEAFLQARAWREWQFQAGRRPGRSLVTLYDEDFPDVTSLDLWNDLQDTPTEDPRHQRALSALLASGHLEGTTRAFASQAAAIESRTRLSFEEAELDWREAPARWRLLPDVPRRHELEEAWRAVLRTELNPVLERWHEALRGQLQPLGSEDWFGFWAGQLGIDVPQLDHLAETLLSTSAELYGYTLGVYLGQLGLPIDDLWRSDLDWALRAPRFDAVFSELNRFPSLVRTFRDLGIELEDQTGLRFEPGPQAGVRCLVVDVPNEVHLVQRLEGGYRDYLASLRALGQAEHVLLTDASLPFWQRWLGDATPTIGYGLLLEGLGRDPTWLASRLEYLTSDDYRVISHLGWLHRVRCAAVGVQTERAIWAAEPGGALAGDIEVALGSALRVRIFPDEYLLQLQNAPWSRLSSAIQLRAEVFAAQLRAFLRREFDEEWWRSARAAHFVKDELWRIGRRYTAEQLLGFMGYEGFDPSILWSEISEVLSPV